MEPILPLDNLLGTEKHYQLFLKIPFESFLVQVEQEPISR